MAKISDPDNLNQGTEVVITPIDAVGSAPSSGYIRLQPKGNFATAHPSAGFEDGVTLQCVYSFLKEEWRNDANLIRYPFPMTPITDEQFEFTNGWDLDNFTLTDYPSYKFIRDGGWALKNTAGSSKEEYMNVTTLGSFAQETGDVQNRDQAYYVPSELGDVDGSLVSSPTSALSPSGFRFTGPVNEAVKIYGSASYGNFDFRDNFAIYLREAGKSFAIYDLLIEQGLSTLTYKKYAMPLTSSSDPKVTNTDADIFTGADYENIIVSYYTAQQARTIGTTDYYFHVIISGDSKTAEQIYEKVQWLLRQDQNININTAKPSGGKVYGQTAEELLRFVGDTLKTNYIGGLGTDGSWGGVFIDGYDTDDINRLTFQDDTNTERQFPFTATGSFVFNDNLVNDGGDGGDPDLITSHAMYWMFHTAIGTSAYGTSTAWIVRDSNDSPISGAASASSIPWTFDYDTNDQGRLAGVNHGRLFEGGGSPRDEDVTVVAIGLSTAQFVQTTSTITRTTSQNISVVAALERNYSNPA